MKIAFLFGAGAEGKGQFNMPSGVEYLNETLLKDVLAKTNSDQNQGDRLSFSNEFGGSLEKEFKSKKFKEGADKYKYRKDYLSEEKLLEYIFLDSIYSIAINNINFAIGYKELIAKVLKENQIVEINEIHNLKDENKIEKKESKKNLENAEFVNFKEIIRYYDNGANAIEIAGIQKYLFSVRDNKIIFSDDVIISGGFLDNKFHTLINPEEYGVGKFSKVFNYYWASYFCIIKKIKEEFKDELGEIVSNGDKVTEALNITKALYEFKREVFLKHESYYKLLNEKIEQNHIECTGIITTNYTPFVKAINICEDSKELNKDNDNIAFINGQLKWFEIPGYLEIVDITKESPQEKNYLYFPFIFGQSKIKPIVHPLQLKEYNKMYEILNKSSVLVSIGYGMNSDDSHLNAYLREFLKDNDHHLIVASEDEKEVIKNKLRLNNTNQITVIQIKEDSKEYRKSRDIFEDIYKELEKIQLKGM